MTRALALAWAAGVAMPVCALEVVVTLRPLHALVASVTDGAGTARLLLERNASGHHVVLKPSSMAMLQSAEVLVWIGPQLETYLVKPLRNPVPGRQVITIAEDVELELLPRRHGLWGHAGPGHGSDVGDLLDMHVWLDPHNAVAIVDHVAAVLARLDQANAGRYQRNAVATRARLKALDQEIAGQLAGVGERPFIVYHDAFQYFEARYALDAIAAISDSDEQRPGAAHLARLRQSVREHGVLCVFLEPGADPGLARVLTEDSDARVARLDPLGVTLTPGPDLYFELLRNNARTMADCLSSGVTMSGS